MEEVIRSVCRRFITKLPADEQGVLWLWSRGYWDCDLDTDYGGRIPSGGIVEQGLEDEFYRRIRDAADDEQLEHDPDADGWDEDDMDNEDGDPERGPGDEEAELTEDEEA